MGAPPLPPTYYVNAAATPSAPYSTPATGANDIATIKAITWVNGVIIEVVAGTDIVEEAPVILNVTGVTIRSYGLTDGGSKSPTDPDRIANKPTGLRAPARWAKRPVT